MKHNRTCRIVKEKNPIPQRQGRPDYNILRPSRKRLLALGRPVGRKATRRATATG